MTSDDDATVSSRFAHNRSCPIARNWIWRRGPVSNMELQQLHADPIRYSVAAEALTSLPTSTNNRATVHEFAIRVTNVPEYV